MEYGDTVNVVQFLKNAWKKQYLAELENNEHTLEESKVRENEEYIDKLRTNENRD